MSTQVASHTKNLPFDQGTMVTPIRVSISSVQACMIDGSSLLGMFADANERWIIAAVVNFIITI